MPINQRIYHKLKDVARRGDPITYHEIAPLANLSMDDPADRNTIAEILGAISTYEDQQGRPLLSSIVVLAGIGYPGVGFFTLARQLRRHHGTTEFEDLEFFVTEVKRVHAHWK